MNWRLEENSGTNAVRELPVLARDYFAAGRDAVKGRKSPGELHRFRVRTKRFRYALEMFRPVYGPDLEPLLEKLQDLQKLLGKISDAYTIRELLKHEGAHKRDLGQHGQKRIAEFKHHWNNVFDAPPEEQLWVDALATMPKEFAHEENE